MALRGSEGEAGARSGPADPSAAAPLGFAGGANVGIAETRAPIVLLRESGRGPRTGGLGAVAGGFREVPGRRRSRAAPDRSGGRAAVGVAAPAAPHSRRSPPPHLPARWQRWRAGGRATRRGIGRTAGGGGAPCGAPRWKRSAGSMKGSSRPGSKTSTWRSGSRRRGTCCATGRRRASPRPGKHGAAPGVRPLPLDLPEPGALPPQTSRRDLGAGGAAPADPRDAGPAAPPPGALPGPGRVARRGVAGVLMVLGGAVSPSPTLPRGVGERAPPPREIREVTGEAFPLPAPRGEGPGEGA